MRIAMLLEQALAPVPGGTGRYSVELTRALAHTAATGDEVTSWTAWHRDVEPARLAAVAGPRRLVLPRRALVAAWQRGVGPVPGRADVVHAPTLLVPPHPSGARLVVTIHDVVPWTFPQTLTPRGVRFHRVMAAHAARYADAVTVPTQAVADALHDHVAGLRPDQVSVIGGGVSPSLTRPPSADLEKAVTDRLDLPPRYLLSLATLEPRKGLDVLLAALARTGPDVTLLLVGQPGWGGVDVAASAADLGLAAHRVRSLGRLSDAELGVVLRRATALCAPSRAEGFGLPIIEAMAVGTPVICSDDPAQVEVSGGAAVVVTRGDAGALATAMTELLADEPARLRLRTAGRRRAAAFDWDVVARQMWALYHSLG